MEVAVFVISRHFSGEGQSGRVRSCAASSDGREEFAWPSTSSITRTKAVICRYSRTYSQFMFNQRRYTCLPNCLYVIVTIRIVNGHGAVFYRMLFGYQRPLLRFLRPAIRYFYGVRQDGGSRGTRGGRAPASRNLSLSCTSRRSKGFQLKNVQCVPLNFPTPLILLK